MFAMLLGPWPRVTADGRGLDELEASVAAGRVADTVLADAVEEAVAQAVAAQVEAGMGLVTDGGVRWADPAAAVLEALRAGDTGPNGLLVRAWRAATALTQAPVAQVVPGPWTLAMGTTERPGGGRGESIDGDRTVDDDRKTDGGRTVDGDLTLDRAGELADALAGELAALAEAGCPVVQVLEPASVTVGTDPRRRAGFLGVHRRLLARADGLHTMLAVTGGSAADAGPEAILGAPYASFLFDLVAGPDNWYLVRAAGTERGIVVAALEAGGGAERRDQAPELVWAAHYAASSNGRGLARVGIANASPLAGLTPDQARTALAGLARAASLAGMPPADAVRAGLDPRVLTRRPPARPPARPPLDG